MLSKLTSIFSPHAKDDDFSRIHAGPSTTTQFCLTSKTTNHCPGTCILHPGTSQQQNEQPLLRRTWSRYLNQCRAACCYLAYSKMIVTSRVEPWVSYWSRQYDHQRRPGSIDPRTSLRSSHHSLAISYRVVAH